MGSSGSASTYGGALLASYTFAPNFSLAGRAEYIGSNGSSSIGAPNLLYGSGSSAYSFTVTPTYQYKRLYIRPELSYVKALDAVSGLALGPYGTKSTEIRGLIETGILF